MDPDPVELRSLAEALDALRRDVTALADRVAVVERSATAQHTGVAEYGTSSAIASELPTGVEGPTPEIVAVISAAIAAYLGVKPHIRQISIVGGASWAQQGRVRIQASHALAVQRD